MALKCLSQRVLGLFSYGFQVTAASLEMKLRMGQPERQLVREVQGVDYISHMKSQIWSRWEKDWHNVGENKLREIKLTVKPWPSSIKTNHREEVILTRLRICHCRITRVI